MHFAQPILSVLFLSTFALADFPPPNNGPWVRGCSSDGGPVPSSLFDAINNEINTADSTTNQMISKVCNDASSSLSGEQTQDLGDFSVTYSILKFQGPWDFCTEAPSAILQGCSIASGDGSQTGGKIQNPFNGPNPNHQEYTFTITPKVQAEPESVPICSGDSSNIDGLTLTSIDDANILLLFSAICASDQCQDPQDQFGCIRTQFVTGSGAMYQIKRQNFGENNFDNCQTAILQIFQQCWAKQKTGGEMGFAKDASGNPSQEFYQFTINALDLTDPVLLVNAEESGNFTSQRRGRKRAVVLPYSGQ